MPPKSNHQQDSDNNNNTTVNINVGILGHVDSGKTSLAKALSRVASTAAFDKNPQSQERGITLDLGFSAFFIDVPPTTTTSNDNKLDEETQQINKFCRESFLLSSSSDSTTSTTDSSSSTLTLQYTLVDCPGHASLIRAVMGAAHIIDLMILVIDITKGIQTQTAECIVLGEMLGRKLVVVLNKIDLVPGDTEEEKRFTIEKKKKALRNVFARTRWPNAPFVEVSANPGSNTSTSSATATATATVTTPPIGIDSLKNTLKLCAARMARSNSLMSLNKKKLDPTQFFMMVDHCFSVKGHGTVLTGTVVGGSVGVGDDVKIPDLGLSRRVKSMQVFRKPVQVAHCGDRIGLCVTQVNAERLERGIACSNAPNSPVITIHHACICSISKVRFFKGEIESSNMIFHVTIGHVTAMATMRFFSLSARRKKEQEKEKEDANAAAAASSSSTNNQKKSTSSQKHSSTNNSNNNKSAFDFAKEYEYEEKITESAVQQFAMPDDEQHGAKNPEDAVGFLDSDREYFAVVLLDRPVTAVVGSMVIASHLDSSEKTTCRLAMHGQLLSGEIAENMPPSLGTFEKDDKEAWRALRVVKYRERQVNIDKVIDNRTCVARPPKQVIAAQKQKEKELKDQQTVVSNNKKQLHHQQQQIEQQVAAANASSGAAGGGGGGGGAAMSQQQQQQPVSTKVVFHQPVIELSKFIGFPVIFRKKGGNKNVKGAANNNSTNTKEKEKGDGDGDDDKKKKDNNKSKADDKKKKTDDDENNKNDKKNDNDEDDEVNGKEEKEKGENGNKTDEKPKKNNKNNNKKAKEKKPKFVDIRGKIDSVVGGATNKVKVVFDEDAFDGPRAFGNVLMLDKKYPFSTAFKVEADL